MDQVFVQEMVNGNCDVVDTMLSQGYIPPEDVIWVPCLYGNVDMLTRLLQYPMNLQKGLKYAIDNKNCHLLDHLFLAGANVNLPDEEGSTSLFYARDAHTCKWLLDMGARQVINNIGHSPLYKACINGHIEVVKLLLSRPDGIETIALPNPNGHTCLYWACNYNYPEIVELLLSFPQGVESISQLSYNGKSCLYQACLNGWIKVARLLLSHPEGIRLISVSNDDGTTPLKTACREDKLKIIKLLLSHPEGIQTINKPDNNGATPLLSACYQRKKPIIKLLLTHPEARATIHTANIYGTSPMTISANNPKIKSLLDKYC